MPSCDPDQTLASLQQADRGIVMNVVLVFCIDTVPPEGNTCGPHDATERLQVASTFHLV